MVHTQVVLTFIGSDRPGIVESLSAEVNRHGGNWLESRLARLAGKFTGVALVSVPSDRVDTFLEAAAHLQDHGLHVVAETSGDAAPGDGEVMRLVVVGHDRPGIVHEFSQALARRQINVIEMSTDITSAPMTGGPLFMAATSIQVPGGQDLDDLREELDGIANELTVEYTLEDED